MVFAYYKNKNKNIFGIYIVCDLYSIIVCDCVLVLYQTAGLVVHNNYV